MKKYNFLNTENNILAGITIVFFVLLGILIGVLIHSRVAEEKYEKAMMFAVEEKGVYGDYSSYVTIAEELNFISLKEKAECLDRAASDRDNKKFLSCALQWIVDKRESLLRKLRILSRLSLCILFFLV